MNDVQKLVTRKNDIFFNHKSGFLKLKHHKKINRIFRIIDFPYSVKNLANRFNLLENQFNFKVY